MTDRKTTAAANKPEPFGVTLCKQGRAAFTEMLSIQCSDQSELNRSLARWEIGIRSRMFRTPELAKCNPAQLVTALCEALQWGFDSAPVANHFSLVPYKSDVQMIPTRQGMQHCAESSGRVEEIRFDVLYRDDAKRMQDAGQTLFDPDTAAPTPPAQKLIDDEGDRTDDAIVGAWCAVKLKDSDRWRSLYMLRSEIEKRRQAGAANGPGWKNWYAEMAIKTVVKKLLRSRRIPLGRTHAVEGAQPAEEIRSVDASVIDDQLQLAETIDLEAMNFEAVDSFGGLPPSRDDSLELIDDAVKAEMISAEDVQSLSIDTYGVVPDELPDALLAMLAQRVSD